MGGHPRVSAHVLSGHHGIRYPEGATDLDIQLDGAGLGAASVLDASGNREVFLSRCHDARWGRAGVAANCSGAPRGVLSRPVVSWGGDRVGYSSSKSIWSKTSL